MKNVLNASVLLFVLLVTSCKKDDANVNEKVLKNTRIESIIYFQYEYINYAWAYSHYGWVIDDNGNVKEYNLPMEWRPIDELGYISKDSLNFNCSQANTVISNIDTIILKEKIALIEDAINGTLTEREGRMADAGTCALYCYYWDNDKGEYKRQILSINGDWAQNNTSEAAINITNWLMDIGRSISPCFMYSCMEK